MPRIFDLFVQGERSLARSEGGLGIGLTLGQNLVRMHSGEIEAKSGGPNLGSEFIVRLPAIRVVLPHSDEKLEGPQRNERKRILVIQSGLKDESQNDRRRCAK